MIKEQKLSTCKRLRTSVRNLNIINIKMIIPDLTGNINHKESCGLNLKMLLMLVGNEMTIVMVEYSYIDSVKELVTSPNVAKDLCV